MNLHPHMLASKLGGASLVARPKYGTVVPLLPVHHAASPDFASLLHQLPVA